MWAADMLIFEGWQPCAHLIATSGAMYRPLGLLALTGEHADTAAGLNLAHKDPFCRLIAGQAIAEGLAVVSSDRAFARPPGATRLW